MKQNTDAVEMDWFELDDVRAALPEGNQRDEVVSMMDEVIGGGTVELSWWDVDALAQEATGDKADELRSTANALA